MTLDQCVMFIKDWMQPQLKDGVACPCCGKPTKEYSRPLNKGMAKTMLILAASSKDPDGWVKISRFAHTDADAKIKNGDYTYLKHWGLIEAKPKEPHTPNPGVWRLTSKGRAFVDGKLAVPHKIFLVNDHLIRMSEETITMDGALGTSFSYEELLSK